MNESTLVESKWWDFWRAKVWQSIRQSAAEDDLRALIEEGCTEEYLLFRLAAVLSWHQEKLERRAAVITPYQIKTAPKNLMRTADLIEGIERVLASRKPDSPAHKQLPQLLREYAKELKLSLQVLRGAERNTLRVAALCSLVKYVEDETGKNHDRLVSSLLGAILGRDSYEAKHLAQWRNDYKQEIERMGRTLVTPLPSRQRKS